MTIRKYLEFNTFKKKYLMCQSNNVTHNPETKSITISTANSNLDGSGSITTLITCTTNKLVVNEVIIKSLGTTTQGMVRLFLIASDTKYLIREIMVPANVQTGVVESFSSTVDLQMTLEDTYALGVSTEKAESFSITANAIGYTNCPC